MEGAVVSMRRTVLRSCKLTNLNLTHSMHAQNNAALRATSSIPIPPLSDLPSCVAGKSDVEDVGPSRPSVFDVR